MATVQTFDDVYFVTEETANQEYFDDAEDIEKLKRLKTVSQSFLKANNFDIEDEPDFEDLSTEQFIEYIETKSKENIILAKLEELNIENTFRSNMSNIYSHKEDPDNKIVIFFLPTDKKSSNTIGVGEITKFITLLFKCDCKEGLMVTEKPLSSSSQKKIDYCNINPENCNDVFNIITYRDDEFIDLTKHSFVPEVVKIIKSGKDALDFGLDNNVDVTKFPRMMADDPLVKFYRGKAGDIFQMKRNLLYTRSLLEHQIVFKIVAVAKNKDKTK